MQTVADPKAAESQRQLATASAAALPLPAAGGSLRYACLSQRGYYPDQPNKANQDAMAAVERLGGSAGGREYTTGWGRAALSSRRFAAEEHLPCLLPASLLLFSLARSPPLPADTHFWGVFDGHGEFGAECAQFVQNKVRSLGWPAAC